MHTIAYRRELINNKTLNSAIGVVFFILATALGAYIRIPMPGTPVPITLQTFFVVLSGAVLGTRLGVFSQAGYIFLGAAGLPVFQGYASGAAHIFGPTGGYLAGFVLASFIAGKMVEGKDAGLLKIAVSFTIANTALYSTGVLWLMLAYKVSLFNAIAMGVLPFVAIEIFKISLASAIYSRIASRSKSVFS